MNVRERVTIDGLPFTWSTNLDDDDLRGFYHRYSDRIREPFPPAESSPRTIRIPFAMDFLEFLEGVCLWTYAGGVHTVLYRSNREWELWNARQAEIQELRDDQAAELGAQRQLLLAEDNFLTEKTDLALKAGDYESAAAYIYARSELHLEFAEPYRISVNWCRWRGDFPFIFTKFPTSSYGMDFLRRYNMQPHAWINFAHWYAVRRSAEGQEFETETGRIYEEAFKVFPENARLFQAACLFWRERRRYDLAMKICAEAIAKGLRDDTKSGFEGRLRRLEREKK